MKRYALNSKKFFNTAEVIAFELVLKRYLGSENRRDALMILLALKTGARAQELLNIERTDIDLESGYVFIRGLKGSNDREIPINETLLRSLRSYLRDITGKPFDITYHRLNQIWDFWRPAKKPFHSLRHTFAMELYSKTKDIKLVQIALGHRNIVNTMIYLDYAYSKTELKKIVL